VEVHNSGRHYLTLSVSEMVQDRHSYSGMWNTNGTNTCPT